MYATGRASFHEVSLMEFTSLVFTLSPLGSPSHGGDVAVYVFDINQPSLPTPFYSVLVPISVFMILSTYFTP